MNLTPGKGTTRTFYTRISFKEMKVLLAYPTLRACYANSFGANRMGTPTGNGNANGKLRESHYFTPCQAKKPDIS